MPKCFNSEVHSNYLQKDYMQCEDIDFKEIFTPMTRFDIDFKETLTPMTRFDSIKTGSAIAAHHE